MATGTGKATGRAPVRLIEAAALGKVLAKAQIAFAWTFVEPGAREAVAFGWDLLDLKALPT